MGLQEWLADKDKINQAAFDARSDSPPPAEGPSGIALGAHLKPSGGWSTKWRPWINIDGATEHTQWGTTFHALAEGQHSIVIWYTNRFRPSRRRGVAERVVTISGNEGLILDYSATVYGPFDNPGRIA